MRSAAWAVGAYMFAGIMLVMIGMFQIIDGLVAIFNDTFYTKLGDYWLKFDVTTWGWIHLVMGIVMVAAGYGLLAGQTWGRIVAIVVAVIGAIENFAFIPYYPFWSILIIAMCIWVVWSLTMHGREIAESRM